MLLPVSWTLLLLIKSRRSGVMKVVHSTERATDSDFVRRDTDGGGGGVLTELIFGRVLVVFM